MKNTKLILISLLSVLLFGVLCVFALNGVQNKAIGYEEQVKTARSTTLSCLE